MQLITLAHLGEAQSIIERLRLKKVSDSLYKGDGISCLITGEGPFEAALRTTAELQHEDYQEVINLGICGALSPEYEIGTIHEVRSIYLAIDGKPQFRSFPVSEQGVDLLTTFERILDPNKALILRGVAGLVDREGWGVAYACKEAAVKFRSFKMISDLAGSLDACELVREKAQVFSQELADYYQEHLSSQKLTANEKSFDLGAEFYFTFASSHRLSASVKKLSLLRNISQADVIASLPLEDLKSRKMSPKERSKLLLEGLDDQLDPFQGRIKTKIMDLKKPWEDKGIRLQVDPRLEDEKIQISFDVANPMDLALKLDELKKFEITPFQKIFRGEIDVE